MDKLFIPVVFVAIAGCYIAIIALYVWVFRSIQEINTKMSDHLQMGDRHVLASNLVFKDVCDEKVGRFGDSIRVVEEKIQELKELVSEEFKELKTIASMNQKDRAGQ